MLNSPNQPNPKPICGRSRKLADTERVFLDRGKTSRFHEIDDKGLHEELSSSDRSVKPEKLSQDIRVKHAHDGTGGPVESSSASTHTQWKNNLFQPNIVTLYHLTRTSSTLQPMDFNIPGVPNSMVKRSHGVNVHNLIQKIENHPQRQALQVIFNNIEHSILSSKNHAMRLQLLGTLNCAIQSTWSRNLSAKHA